MAKRARPSGLGPKLARIDELLAEHDPAVAKLMRPGATAARLARLVRTIAVPADVVTLFRWHDGQRRPAQLHDGDNRAPLSIAEALDVHEFLCDPDEDVLPPWSKTWLPLFTNGAGDFLCVETAKRGRGRLIEYRHDDEDRPLEFASLAAWADATIDALRTAGPAGKAGRRVVLDAGKTRWKKLAKPPTEAQLARRPIGAALYWKTRNHITNSAFTYLYVKVEADAELGWRHARHKDLAQAVGKLQELLDAAKPPADSFWKESAFSVAFNAKESNFDAAAEHPRRVEVFEGAIAIA